MFLGKPVKFAKDCIGSIAEEAVAELKPGEVLLLENLRYYNEEEEGNKDFAGQLAKLGDIYINDAFGTAHRKHASTAVIAEFFPENKTFGFLMAQELDAIDKVLHNGERPITAILGGSKVSSKITIIENILPAVDNLIIGCGMAFTFIKAKGGHIDVVAAKEFNNDAESKQFDAYDIPEGWMGLDAGEKTSEKFNDVVLSSKTILWNGPLGVFEMPNFATGTIKLGDSIAEATKLNAFSLVGGGDSVAFAKQYGYDEKVSYVSTGGGAMLESLEGKELPGVAAIKN
ncbi:hypothetical protein FQR65_LT16997 [Abscondita terminalis]|nr:hypothetical protein FQR65_LT16997 [Abscondita terminalis]